VAHGGLDFSVLVLGYLGELFYLVRAEGFELVLEGLGLFFQKAELFL
jgi:hypothetical protein